MTIVNKVAQSGLITLDLEEMMLPGERVLFDLKSWLFEELILKEKDFREHISRHDWSQYKDKYIALTCSADAIIPTWAFMLIAVQLQAYAKKIVFGNLAALESELFTESIAQLNPEDYKDQRVVIKGCSIRQVPVGAYVELTAFLAPLVKSIMYGEPCSTVPVYKRKS
ncbi:MAG: DUF2480 family protein [Bacteroidetes bacterium]|nr:MAG: DUF2480 family protein [Bacteroidota bacterium]